ncbi:MAG: YncE family protein [Gaiellaceae bacterium]
MNRREFVALAAAAPFGLHATLAAAARAPYALVTCDDESRLAVVDLGAFRIVRFIATPAGPRAIERVGDHAVVAHWALGSVAVVDANRTLHVIEGVDAPRYAAAHPDGVHAFVTDSAYGLVSIDVQRGRIVGRVRLPGWPRHVSLDPSGKTLWVGLGTSSTQVAVVDVTDPRRPRRAALVMPPFGAHDVGFSPDGRHVWVTSGDVGETAVYTHGRKLQGTLHADAAPQHVTFGSAAAYVTSGDSGTLRVHSQATGRVVRTTPIPVGSYNVQHGPGRVITPSLSHGTLTILDERGALLAKVHVAASCHDACFAPD